jgi:hypothetical protein
MLAHSASRRGSDDPGTAAARRPAIGSADEGRFGCCSMLLDRTMARLDGCIDGPRFKRAMPCLTAPLCVAFLCTFIRQAAAQWWSSESWRWSGQTIDAAAAAGPLAAWLACAASLYGGLTLASAATLAARCFEPGGPLKAKRATAMCAHHHRRYATVVA